MNVEFILVIHGIFRIFIRKIILTLCYYRLEDIIDTRLKNVICNKPPSICNPYFWK